MIPIFVMISVVVSISLAGYLSKKKQTATDYARLAERGAKASYLWNHSLEEERKLILSSSTHAVDKAQNDLLTKGFSELPALLGIEITDTLSRIPEFNGEWHSELQLVQGSLRNRTTLAPHYPIRK